ncbi:MAG: ABC-2 transporter permease [Oscillospiraceae bacterium]
MKGLIIKDLYTTMSQLSRYLIIALIFILIQHDASSLMFVVVLASMLPITALAYDERSKWDRYAAMLPYKRAEIVLSKYIFGYICIFVSLLIASIIIFAISFIFKNPVKNLFESAFVFGLLGTTFTSFNLPLTFKYGTEKSRILMFVFPVIIIAISTFMITLNNTIFDLFGFLNGIWGEFLIVIAVILINIISIFLSINIYRKKDL